MTFQQQQQQIQLLQLQLQEQQQQLLRQQQQLQQPHQLHHALPSIPLDQSTLALLQYQYQRQQQFLASREMVAAETTNDDDNNRTTTTTAVQPNLKSGFFASVPGKLTATVVPTTVISPTATKTVSTRSATKSGKVVPEDDDDDDDADDKAAEMTLSGKIRELNLSTKRQQQQQRKGGKGKSKRRTVEHSDEEEEEDVEAAKKQKRDPRAVAKENLLNGVDLRSIIPCDGYDFHVLCTIQPKDFNAEAGDHMLMIVFAGFRDIRDARKHVKKWQKEEPRLKLHIVYSCVLGEVPMPKDAPSKREYASEEKSKFFTAYEQQQKAPDRTIRKERIRQEEAVSTTGVKDKNSLFPLKTTTMTTGDGKISVGAVLK